MPELLLDDNPAYRQFVEPDEAGFTLRTHYRGTEGVLDRNAELRAEAPRTFREDGHDFHHVGSIPLEVYEQLRIRLNREPSVQELIALINDIDYCKLRTRDARV